jgi:hypothetical protein
MTKPDTRRAGLLRDLQSLRDAIGELALKLEESGEDSPDAARAQGDLAALQRELAGAEQRLASYDLAREAAARRVEVQSSAETEEQVAKHLQRIGDLHRASTTRALKMMRSIEALGAEWGALLTDLGEARALTAAAVHLRGGGRAVQRLANNIDGHDVVAGAVGPALACTGLGVTGPSLAPWIIVSPPSGAFAPVGLGAALERLYERRIEAIAKASTFAKPSEAAA